MEKNKKNNLKKNEISKNKNLVQNNSNIDTNLFSFVKQNWEKIENEYNLIIKKFEKFNEKIKEQEIKKEYKSLISFLTDSKNNFKNIFFNISINIINISKANTEKINLSYDYIYNEMENLESVIKDLNNVQNKKKLNNKMKVQNLENKLHEYMDEVENFDFDYIEKIYDVYNSFNKEEFEKNLLQNNFIEQYNNKEVDYNKNIYENNLLNINTLNHDSSDINNIK